MHVTRSSTRSSARWALLLLCAAMMVSASACAATSSARHVAGTGTLEVRNWTDADLWIALDGQVIGTVDKGTRARYRWLSPGPVKAAATATPDNQGFDRSFAADLAIAAGRTSTWDLKLAGTDGKEPPALSDLVVKNTLSKAVAVYVDDRRVGQVLPGDHRRFRDVLAGSRALHASDAEATMLLRHTLVLPPGGEAAWDIAAAGATLAIVNDTPSAVDVYVDEALLGTLGPGEKKTWADQLVGSHDVKAVARVTGQRYFRVLELRADFPETWELSSAHVSVVVDNGADEPVEVSVGDTKRVLAPGKRTKLEGLDAGTLELLATGTKTGLHYTDTVQLEPGQLYHWQVAPVRRTMRVVNRTQQRLVVYADGHERATIPPGEQRLVRDIRRDTVKLLAIAFDRRHAFRLDVAFGNDRSAQWVIRADSGDLHVENRRPEQMQVFVDARKVGEVDPNASMAFSGIEVGPHLVEFLGSSSGQVLAEQRRFRKAQPERVVLEDPRGFLTIVNATGEALYARDFLAAQQREVAVGRSGTFAVAPGAQTVALVGRESGLTYSQAVHILAGRKHRWEVQRARGTLVVVNDLDEAFALSIDGSLYGTVRPHSRMAVPKVDAGRHRLRAEGETTRKIFNVFRTMPPDGQVFWTLKDVPATLQVFNETQEALEIRLEGRAYGRVEALSSVRFGALKAGHREVVGLGLKSGLVHRFEVPLQHGRTDRITVLPPHSRLVIVNRSGEALTVRVDGAVVGTVPAAAEVTHLPAPAGERLIRIERQGSGIPELISTVLRADEALYLPVPPVQARLAIVNRLSKTRLVYAGDRFLGKIEPGGSLVIDDLEVGEIMFRARNESATTTHQERRRLDAGGTATWVLLPTERLD